MHLRVFVSSPGDVADERDRARSLLKDKLPYRPFLRGRVTFDVVSWDDPAARVPMLATLTPQESVNRGMPKPSACHIVVVVLWSRMGTELPAAIRRVVPVPSLAGTEWESRYLSGTEWEFEDAVHAGPVPGTGRAPEVLVYRRRAQLPEVLAFYGVDSLEGQRFEEVRDQLRRVETFFARFQDPSGGLARSVTPYHTPSEFHDLLAADVESLVKQRLDTPGLGADADALLRALAAATRQDTTLSADRVNELGTQLGLSAGAVLGAVERLRRAGAVQLRWGGGVSVVAPERSPRG